MEQVSTNVNTPRRGRPPKIVRPPGRRGRMLGEKVKKKEMNLRPYIMRVIHQYTPGHGIKKSAMDNMNTIAIDIMKSLTRECAELMEHGKQKVM